MSERKVQFILFCGTLALCLLTASTTVQGSDSGEIITVAAKGGVLHPPGFPVYWLLARTVAAIPFGSVAFRLSCLSAVAAALAVFCVFGAARAWGGTILASTLAAIGLAVTPPLWSMGGMPEVFAWAAAAVAAVAWVAARGHCRLAGLLLGLALSTHPATLVAFPLWISSFRGHRFSRWVQSVSLAGIGLSAYLVLLTIRGGAWHWGDASTLLGLLHHILRADYGSLSLSIQSSGSLGGHAVRFVGDLPVRWLVLVLPLVAGLARAPLGLRVSLALSLLFYGLFNVGSLPLELAVTERFFVLGDVLVTPLVALGVDRICSVADFRRPLKIVLISGLVSSLVFTFKKANWRADRAIEQYVQDVCRVAAPNAVILGRGDLPTFPLLYGQKVLGLRPDIVYIDVGLLLYRWYYEETRAKVGDLGIPYDRDNVNTVGLALTQATRRPVYLAQIYNDAIRPLISHPEGPLIRLLSPTDSTPPCEKVAKQLAQFPPPRARPSPWSQWVRDRYAMAYRAVAGCQQK